jgi:hypothetical protein
MISVLLRPVIRSAGKAFRAGFHALFPDYDLETRKVL